jgi:hypothetical protein
MGATYPYTLSEERGMQLPLTEAQHSALITGRLIYDTHGGVCRLTWATVESFNGNARRALDHVEGYLDAIDHGWSLAEYERASS